MKDFYVGMAKADITPPLGTLLYGYPSERPSNNLLDELKVGAVAVKQGDKTVVFISADICAMNQDKCDIVAEAIADATGVKKDNILYSCIHTHSAPITRTSAGWGTADMDYVSNTLIPKSIEAAKNAISNMEPAVMGIGYAESYAGINRRELTSDGEVILGQNPDGPYDPTMTAFVFKGTDGKGIGTMIHFATHPTSAGENLSITRDWPGYMIDRVEEITGAPCMYINGAEGDIGPRLSNGRTTGAGDESYIREIGLIAAEDVAKAVNSITEFKVPELKIMTETIKLPFIDMPSLESVIKDMEAMGDPSKLIEVDISTYARLEKIKKIYEDGEEIPTCMELKQTVISLDELAIVPLPFETFCNIALSLREESPYKQTLLFGLTGGSFGYLPTEDQLPYGGYEIGSFRAATIPGFVDSLDKHIVDENVNLLNKLYNK